MNTDSVAVSNGVEIMGEKLSVSAIIADPASFVALSSKKDDLTS